MGNPRLLHLIPSINRGGIETLVLDLTRRQCLLYDVTVWYTGEVPHSPTLERQFRESGVRAVTRIVPPSPRELVRSRPPEAFKKIAEFDIVHNHIYPYFYLIGAIKRYCGARLVSTLHTIYQRPHPLRHPCLFWNEYRFGRRVDALTVVSDAVRRTVTFPARIQIIHNGVDLKAFPFVRRVHDPGEPFTFVCVANLRPHVKGYEVLLPAFDRVHKKYVRTRLICVGYFDPSYRDALMKGLSCGPCVHFTGSVPDTAPFLYRAHAFALFSQREGFGISVLEAAASGLPVIASRAGGIPEIIRDDSLGYLLTSADARSAARLMEEVMLDYPAALERAEKCYELVRSAYTVEETYKSYRALYEPSATTSAERSPGSAGGAFPRRTVSKRIGRPSGEWGGAGGRGWDGRPQ